jgi:hypothetical protein
MATKLHYHIRWSTKPNLDWQPFDTAAEAETAATYMLLPDETFTVEEAGEMCSRCTDRPEPKSVRPVSPDARKRVP